MARILVVEDEAIIIEVVRDSLAGTEHEVSDALDGTRAIELVEAWAPELIVLDLNLGGDVNGLDVCQYVRSHEHTRDILIVVLTGETGDALELTLFDAGADDFVRKQRFRAGLFRRRIEAVLRRAALEPHEEKLGLGPLVLDPARREAMLGTTSLRLTPTEFDIVHTLVTNQERIVSRQELLDRGSGIADPATSRAVDMHIKQIRKKLGPHAGMIGTVYGQGYRLEATILTAE